MELGDDRRPEDPRKTSSGMLGPPGWVATATLCNWGALGVQELHLADNLPVNVLVHALLENLLAAPRHQEISLGP